MNVGDAPLVRILPVVCGFVPDMNLALLPGCVPNSFHFFILLIFVPPTLAVRGNVLDELAILVKVGIIFLVGDPGDTSGSTPLGRGDTSWRRAFNVSRGSAALLSHLDGCGMIVEGSRFAGPLLVAHRRVQYK